MKKHSLPGVFKQVLLNLRFSFVLVLMFFVAFTGKSQNCKVSGTIIDKADNQPVIGAYVILNDLKDTTIRVGTTTNVDGKFLVTDVKKKSYRLTIQSINYQRDSRIITISKSTTDLGEVG